MKYYASPNKIKQISRSDITLYRNILDFDRLHWHRFFSPAFQNPIIFPKRENLFS